MNSNHLFIIVLLGLSFSILCITADADSIYTSALEGPFGDQLKCTVTNVTNNPVQVTVTMYDDSGNIFNGPGTTTIDPKHVVSIFVTVNSDTLYFCKFNTQNKLDIRANAFLIDSKDSRIIAVVTAK